MDLLTISIMLAAGLLHASWHALVRGGSDRIVTLAGMGVVSAGPALAAIPFLPAPPAAVWPILAASVLLHGIYKACLASAYSAADLSVAFPLARGSVPVFATLIAFGGLGQIPNTAQVAGVCLISGGILTLSRAGHDRSVTWPLAAAIVAIGIAVASYTVLDAYGTRVYGDWMGFTSWLIVLDTFAFLVFSRAVRGPRLWGQVMQMRGRAAVSGILGLAAFGVFLWALSRNPVGPVAAIRETSVLFAMLIGAFVYKERVSAMRLIAGLTILIGIGVIAVSK